MEAGLLGERYFIQHSAQKPNITSPSIRSDTVVVFCVVPASAADDKDQDSLDCNY